jgi:PAS domain S-box-containing protein
VTEDRPRETAPSAARLESILRRLAGESGRATDSATTTTTLPPPPRPAPHSLPVRPGAVAPPLPTADTLLKLVEAVPDALVVVDAAGRIALVNAETEAMFGYRREELLGQAIEVLVPERYKEKHVGQRDGFLAAPHQRPMGRGLELLGRRKDGQEVPVEISLSPLVTDAGLLVVASVRDVSERRRSVAQLRKIEARYRTLVEGIPAVTFMAPMDEGPGELYVSPQIEELLGFSQREWVENPILWYTQLHPEDQARWHDEFARTVSTGEPFRSIYRFVARDGRVVWVHGEAKVVRDEAGRPLFLQGVAFDISGMKRAEEELKALNATLEERIAERTRELTRSNQALARFAGTAAHDLKSPLVTIKSWTQTVTSDYAEALDETARRHLTRVENAAERMKTLIDDLLVYSKVRTEGKDPVPVSCLEALEWACENLGAAIEETGAEVTAAELPTLLADRTQLAQVLQNLVGNALKYRADRPPQVHVSARPEGSFWAIAVADNGIGIEPQYLHKIFDLGVVSRVDHRKAIPGSGIGLATCEVIVQRHGGRIWAESAGRDCGTTITFTMPAAPTSEPDA